MSRFISDYEAELYDNRRTIESLEDDIEDLCTQVNDLTCELNCRDGVIELLDHEKQTIIAQCEAWESAYKKVALDVIAQRDAIRRLNEDREQWEIGVAADLIALRAATQELDSVQALEWKARKQELRHLRQEALDSAAQQRGADSETLPVWISIQDQPQPPTPEDDQPQAAEHSPSAPKRPPETPLPQYSLRPWGWESPKPESEDPSPQQ